MRSKKCTQIHLWQSPSF